MTFPEVRHAKSMLIDAIQNLRSVAVFNKPGIPAYDAADGYVTQWENELNKRLDAYEKETGSRPF